MTRRQFGLSLSAALSVRAQGPEARWALFSDTHIPADAANEYRGFRPVENLRKIVPQIAEWKPEGALISGDLARLNGQPGDYQALKSLLEPVLGQCPVAMALGNHDHRDNFLAAFGAAQRGAQPLKNRHVLDLDAGPVRQLVLDSLVLPDSTPGLLGKAQRLWLADSLDASRKPALVIVHHTLGDNDGELLDAPRLFDIVKTRRQVKAVLFGHSHVYSYETWEGIHLINLPAVGYNFRDSEPVGWVEARLRADGASFRLRAFGGNMAGDGKTTEVKWRS